MQLSAENLREYFEQGFLVLPDFFPVPVIEAMVAEIEASMKDPAVTKANRANFNFAQAPAGAGDRAGAENKAEGKYYVLQALKSENLSKTIKDTIHSEKVLEMVGSILGPDVDLFQAKLVFKKAHGGAEVPWHQDFDYWKNFSKSPLQLNVGIYLDDTNKENGCLEVIPGSHRTGLHSHRNRKDLLNFPIQWSASPEAAQVRSIEGRKGTVILFSALTAHHSQVNNSARRRLFLNLVFTPAGNTSAGQDSIPQPVVARKPAKVEVKREMDTQRIPGIWGPGPHGGQCAGQYRTKELWKQAITESDPELLDWVYIHANQAADTAPEWFTARRKGQTNFVHMRSGGDRYRDRENAHFLIGDLMDNLLAGRFREALRGSIGILVLQSQDYFTVKRLLEHFGPMLKPGTVLVFESMFDGPKWEEGAAYALLEFAQGSRLGLKYLSKTERGLLLRIESTGNAYRTDYAETPWISHTQGISTGFGIPAEAPPPASMNPVKRIKKVLQPLREDAFPSPFYRDFFPGKKIPQFKGGNLSGPCCGTHLRRKELWKYALSFVADPKLAWAEFGVGEGESLDWFALNKPQDNVLFGFDSFQGIPEAWASAPKGQWKTAIYSPNRPDVKIVPGLYDETLTTPAILEALGPRLGFIHIDCDLYSSTKMVFQAIKNRIGPGTVIVFDELYGYHDWQKHEAKAFFEMAQERKWEYEYLARSDLQVAVRIVTIAARWTCTVRDIRWTEGGNYIRLDRGDDLILGYSTRKLGEYAKVFVKRAKQLLIKT